MAGVIELTFEQKVLCATPQMRALQKHDASFTVLLCENDRDQMKGSWIKSAKLSLKQPLLLGAVADERAWSIR